MNTMSYFDDVYRAEDPFGYRNRWYEARKRALTLACLPRPHYANAWELGCSNGVLTAELAPRCDALLATDLSAAALKSAARSTARWPHVRLQQASHPRDWPDGQFDLIIVSELGYYLPPQDVLTLARRLHGSLTADGLLLACHWCHPFAQALSSADQVHQALSQGLVEAFTYTDADLLLQAWGVDATSVAQRQGLR